MSGAVPLIPLFIHFVLLYKCTLPHLFIPQSFCFVLYTYIYYVECVIFDAISNAVSRPMNSDNPQNTVYTAVDLHLSEQ